MSGILSLPKPLLTMEQFCVAICKEQHVVCFFFFLSSYSQHKNDLVKHTACAKQEVRKVVIQKAFHVSSILNLEGILDAGTFEL